MSEIEPIGPAETATVEVKVYRDGHLVHTQLCESAEEAAALVASWEETPGTECLVEDLSATLHDESGMEVDGTGPDEMYPTTGPADGG
ncbi:MAG: hypothetical protein WBM50_27285 [Acidimicrobiales bacterium]